MTIGVPSPAIILLIGEISRLKHGGSQPQTSDDCRARRRMAMSVRFQCAAQLTARQHSFAARPPADSSESPVIMSGSVTSDGLYERRFSLA